MKYLFLIIFVAVSYIGYRYYEGMKVDHVREAEALQLDHSAAIQDLVERAEAITVDYQLTADNFAICESGYQEKMDALMKSTRTAIDGVIKERKPADESKPGGSKVKFYNELVEQLPPIQVKIAEAEQAYAQAQTEANKAIERNNMSSSSFIKEIEGKLALLEGAEDLDFPAQKDKIRQNGLLLQKASSSANVGLSRDLDKQRNEYERTVISCYNEIDNIEKKIVNVLNAGRPGARGPSGPSEIVKILNRFDQNVRKNRREHGDEVTRLDNDMLLKQRQIDAVVQKADKLDETYARRYEEMEAKQQKHLLFAKVIIGSISLCLLLVTIFVFVGAKKVKEVEHTDYRSS